MPVNIPSDLLESFQSNQVHLFIGSGVSVASGLLGWDTLIGEMKDIILNENREFTQEDLRAFLDNSDYLDIADLFKQTVQENRYFRFLRAHYRRNVALSLLHRRISQLPTRTVFTTNFDHLLESTFRTMVGQEPAVIIYPEQLGYTENNELRIIKLHGDIDHPSTITLTRTDYSAYSSRQREFIRRLQLSINDFTVLFIGFGLRDSNFLRIYQDARNFYDSGRRSAYAIMVGTNPVQRKLWEKDGLIILPVNKYNQVPPYLYRIRNQL